MFLPRDQMKIRTAMNAATVIDVLRKNTKNSWFATPRSGKVFFGEVEDGRFAVSRVLDYQNAFVPRMVGSVIPDGNGSSISIRMTLNSWVGISIKLMIGFLFVMGSVAVISGIVLLRSGDMAGWGYVLSPLIPFVFVRYLVFTGFREEVPQSKHCLIELLDGTEVGSEPFGSDN